MMKGDEEIHEMLVNDGEDYSTVRPRHYHEGGIDVFKYAEKNFTLEELSGYHRITAIKYASRAGKKGPQIDDLEKGASHLQEMARLLREAGR